MSSRADLAAIAEIDRWLDSNPIAQVVAEEDERAETVPFEPPTRGSYVPPPPNEGPCCHGECSCNGESYPRWGR